MTGVPGIIRQTYYGLNLFNRQYLCGMCLKVVTILFLYEGTTVEATRLTDKGGGGAL